jgi:hypothetical protein
MMHLLNGSSKTSDDATHVRANARHPFAPLSTGSASADSANDAVPGDESVRMPQNFISWNEFTRIDFWS